MSELSSLAVDVPADLIAEIAVGVEEADDIAFRFGIDGVQWERLKAMPMFLKAVADKREELEKSGASFRTKSKLKAEMLSDKLFVRVMATDAPIGGMLSALDHYVRVADLAPKTAVAAGTGSGFSITINLPGPPAAAKDIVTVEHQDQLPVYLIGKPVEELPR